MTTTYTGTMTTNQFRNILAFATLVSGESPEVLHYSPDYIIEKFTRYIGKLPADTEHWNWGHHPRLCEVIEAYCLRWAIDDPEVMCSYGWPVQE